MSDQTETPPPPYWSLQPPPYWSLQPPPYWSLQPPPPDYSSSPSTSDYSTSPSSPSYSTPAPSSPDVNSQRIVIGYDTNNQEIAMCCFLWTTNTLRSQYNTLAKFYYGQYSGTIHYQPKLMCKLHSDFQHLAFEDDPRPGFIREWMGRFDTIPSERNGAGIEMGGERKRMRVKFVWVDPEDTRKEMRMFRGKDGSYGVEVERWARSRFWGRMERVKGRCLAKDNVEVI